MLTHKVIHAAYSYQPILTLVNLCKSFKILSFEPNYTYFNKIFKQK